MLDIKTDVMILFSQMRKLIALGSVGFFLGVCEWTPCVKADALDAAQADQRSAVTAKKTINLQLPAVVRRYDVGEDATTGRLKRFLVSPISSSRKVNARFATRSEVIKGPSVGSEGWVSVDELVRRTGRQYGVDPNLIHAIIRQESNYNPFAVSHKGAEGLMQLMPETADRFGVSNIFDPAENVAGGVRYLRYLLDRYEGDPRLTLAAYNAGEGAVERAQGVPSYPETRDYVNRVSRIYAVTGRPTASEQAKQSAGNTIRPRIVVYVDSEGMTRFETAPK